MLMLTIQEYKEFLNSVDMSFYNNMESFFSTFEDKDKRSNRIYLKLNVEQIKLTPDRVLSNFLYCNGYSIKDYTEGICIDNKKGAEKETTIRIGKVLKKLEREDLLKIYSDSKDSILKNTKNLTVVISRHPYDCIGMSTRRGWTSCHDLHDKNYSGKYLYQMRDVLAKGCLLAYLIRDNDRNITNPIARSCIKNFGNILSHSNVLGTNIPEFEVIINKFSYKYTEYLRSKRRNGIK